MNCLIAKLRRHFLDGFSLDDDLPINEKARLMDGRVPSPLVRLTWACGKEFFDMKIAVIDGRAKLAIAKLPDATGFLCFERDSTPDNCLLLDAHGKERMRLTVPWQLTKPRNPESAKPPTSFANISAPYINPADGKEGTFGVTAWVEHAGRYYFELDYHSGEFLWGREIRD
jgi:hypothetical protein